LEYNTRDSAMAIYDILEHLEKKMEEEKNTSHFPHHISQTQMKKEENVPESHIFSSIAIRLFFFILLIVDIFWSILTIAGFFISLIGNVITGFKWMTLKKFFLRRWLNFKRSCICALALFIALFSPALGTMFACSYFLMYDKRGIEEVVPSILQDQFKEFLNPS